MMRQRQQKILEHIQNVGIASYDELAQLFDVSPFTIRRDIEYLDQSKLVVRVKGGAQRVETASQFAEARLPNRMQINLRQKEKIAAKAIEFIHPGDSIFLDGSSTIICLGRLLAQQNPSVTVVTNSVLNMLELSQASHIRLVGLGGVFDMETFSFVGFDSDAHGDLFYINKAFFSCTGLIPAEGTFENAAFNRNTKRVVAARAEKVYLLADSTKLGQRALNRVLTPDEFDTLITDNPLHADDRLTLRDHHVEVHYCTKNKSL